MPPAQIEAQPAANKLLDFVEKMSLSEIDQFLSQVLALRAQRKVPHLSAKESELLIKINQGLPPVVQTRLNQLAAKRRAGTLTAKEHQELLSLTDQLENAEAKRVEALGELARLRGVSLTTLMHDLGIRPPEYA